MTQTNRDELFVELVEALRKHSAFWEALAAHEFEYCSDLPYDEFLDLAHKHGLLVKVPYSYEKYGDESEYDLEDGDDFYVNTHEARALLSKIEPETPKVKTK